MKSTDGLACSVERREPLLEHGAHMAAKAIKKYQVERMLENATRDLRDQYDDCGDVVFGEARYVTDADEPGGNWVAEIIGGTEAGRSKFDSALQKMRKAHHMID
jgi:hypothetical protein